MCGILGSVGSSTSRERFQTALDLMTSRGPDAGAIWNEGKLNFGHRRLSIIDTSSDANQPFQSGDYTIVFNGEIYNYKSVREKLIALGYTFRTTSDTEVLIKSYEAWGKDCTVELDGMWAFVIYDKKRNLLFFSRDRIGEKPLLYSVTKDGIIFGSEMRSMLALLDTSPKPALSALSQFGVYNFRHIPSPLTPFEDIYKLEPGYSLTYSLETGEIEKEKYFILERQPVAGDPVELCDKLMRESVAQACYAEVPVGVLLSGGVDSSLIASLMQDREIMTYSLGWDEHDEEIIRAKDIAEHLGLKNTTIYYKEYMENVNLIDIIKKNIHHYGEPINLFQIIYTDILLTRMRQDGIKVVVGGNGADELFYGYDGMNTLSFLSRVKSITDILRLSWIFRLFPKISFLSQRGENTKVSLYEKILRETPYLKEEYRVFHYTDILREYALELPRKSLLEIFSWLGLRVENEHSITLVGDIAGSMTGMEVRTPFLSKEILSFSTNLDTKYKVRSYFSKRENKYVLKKVLEKYLPTSLVYRKKMGFGYGIRYDDFVVKYKTEFDYYFEHILPQIPIYETEKVQEMLAGNEKKDTNTLINILIMCIWWEKFII